MLSGSPSEKGLRNGGRDGCGRTHLYLNVYDLTPINKYLYWFGLGVFHSGIEVHGQEYGFGAHDYPSSGVFEVEPKSCPGFIFRRSVWLGTTIPENIRVSAVRTITNSSNLFWIILLLYYPRKYSEDDFDSFSSSSIEDSDEEDADHHLIKRPNIDFVHSSDEPLRLARDVIINLTEISTQLWFGQTRYVYGLGPRQLVP
ncbi:hypothetical protein C4D60_Mb05t05390 [Musa balbisiana]|uniref:PPPDE domain-containing protein n=1 Tax=Musa balbisiana TaxID=52838 RepID=A0A4S8JTV0_MUSBA|nr:hypothetical protein C4D60_Mb05t05390 [Musa balbisiana]